MAAHVPECAPIAVLVWCQLVTRSGLEPMRAATIMPDRFYATLFTLRRRWPHNDCFRNPVENRSRLTGKLLQSVVRRRGSALT